MEIKLFASYMDFGDGSFGIKLHNTKDEALDRLGRTEKQLENGNIYDDGAIKPLILEINNEGKLINNPSITIE